MRSALAASAVLALAGTSYGFVVNQFAVVPGGFIAPSSGTFVNYGQGYFTGPGAVVQDARATWKNYGNLILSTTWLAVDPAGGGPTIDAYNNTFSRVLAGLGGDPIVPQWSGSTANWLGSGTYGVDHGLLNDGSAILGGGAGVSWGAGSGDSFNATSSVSEVNGRSVDSIFFGYFVLSDPNATLVGTDLLMTINLGGGQSENVFLPLGGNATRGTGGYGIEYETSVSPDGHTVLKGFVVVPAPGAMGVMGLAGLAAVRRRRT